MVHSRMPHSHSIFRMFSGSINHPVTESVVAIMVIVIVFRFGWTLEDC